MKQTYYIFHSGTLSRKDNSLLFSPTPKEGRDSTPRYIPIENTESIYAFGSIHATSSLFNFLGLKHIPMHFFDYFENYTGSFIPRESLHNGQLLVAQCSAFANPHKRLTIAKNILDGGIYNMRKNLIYYAARGKDIEQQIQRIDVLRKQFDQVDSISYLMGIEGNIRKIYYSCFDYILNDFTMGSRSSRPPLNEVNALISFGNMMCYTQCLQAIYQTQLNPDVSFLHSPSENRFSLPLDIAEIFKPIIIDRVLFKVLNKRILSKDNFSSNYKGINLDKEGKSLYIQNIQDRLNQIVMHKTLNRPVSIKQMIKLECYKLIHYVQEEESYEPLKMWW